MNRLFACVGLGLLLYGGVSSSESRVARADIAVHGMILVDCNITLTNIATQPEVLFVAEINKRRHGVPRYSDNFAYLQEGRNTFTEQVTDKGRWKVTLFALPKSSELGAKLLQAAKVSNWNEYRAKGEAGLEILFRTGYFPGNALKTYAIGNPIEQDGNYKIVPLQNGRYTWEPQSTPVTADRPPVRNASDGSTMWMLIVPISAAVLIMVILYARNRGVRSPKTGEQKPGDHVG